MNATCRSCGQVFSPPDALLERYPGWTPSRCPACFRSSASSTGSEASRGSGGGSGAPDRSPRGGAKRRGSPREEGLTRAQVLERYTDGPQSGVFTDGSASPNPGPGGWGAVYVVDGEIRGEDHGYEAQTTNNRMELTALLAAVELVPAGEPAVLYSDSNLSVRTINEWAAGWERRGWRRKTGRVENLDLVRALYERLRARPELELVWIRAHAGNRWNEYADALATAWMRDVV